MYYLITTELKLTLSQNVFIFGKLAFCKKMKEEFQYYEK